MMAFVGKIHLKYYFKFDLKVEKAIATTKNVLSKMCRSQLFDCNKVLCIVLCLVNSPCKLTTSVCNRS